MTKEGIESLELNAKAGNGLALEAAEVHDTMYRDALSTLNEMRKLESFQDAQRPFFTAVGLMKPHLPFNVPQKCWDMYLELCI